MDFEAQRKKRMEDLAMKRKRLEEMRKQRLEKNKPIEEKTNATETPVVSPPLPPPPADNVNVDDLVNSLLASDNDPPSSSTVATTKDETVGDTSSSTPVLSHLEQRQQRSGEWTTCQNVCSFTVLPCVPELYDKGIQTDCNGEDETESFEVGETQEAMSYHRTPQRSHRRSRGDSISEDASPSKLTQISVETVSYSPADIARIVASPSFASFLSNSSLVMERALELSNSMDFLRDLTGQQTEADSKTNSGSDILHRARIYHNEKVASRPVMDIQVSPHHADLFATSYGSAVGAVPGGNAGGMVCLWSLLLPQTPELVFIASSPVLAVRFHPENVHLVIGACYSGQILLWDTRNTSSRAVQRSASSGKGHKHPVYSMCLARRGSSSAGKGGDWVLITASTDGLLCHWDLENLNEPISSTVIRSRMLNSDLLKSHSGNSSDATERAISVSCIGLGPEEDDRKLMVGSECGSLFCFTLPFKANSPYCKIDAHFGMITSLSVNPSTLPSFKHLLLTSSVDWTVKLWHIQELSNFDMQEVLPLLTFPSSTFQYVTSVQWSPLHPGIFSTTVSGGKLLLWNISHSIVEPVGSCQIQSQASESNISAITHSTLSKGAWLDDGRKLLIGDSRGGTQCITVRSTAATSLRTGDEERIELAISLQFTKLASRRGGAIGSRDASADIIDDGSSEEKQS